jgi:hypothetical protein
MRSALVLAAVLVAVLAGEPAGAETVDLQLVLAADVSRSMTEEQFRLQRQGYAAALTDERVLKAITSGPSRAVAICFIEFAGATDQKVVVDWTLVRDTESAGIFADILATAPRSFYGWTSISAAIDFSVRQLQSSGFASERLAIDVSGDGTNNSGRPVVSARDDAVAAGVVINGLPIINTSPTTFNPEHTHPAGGLAEYYRQNVIGGPGAFHIVVEGFDTFAEGITKKLISEIAGTPPESHHAGR